jgi:hypothetical protein
VPERLVHHAAEDGRLIRDCDLHGFLRSVVVFVAVVKTALAAPAMVGVAGRWAQVITEHLAVRPHQAAGQRRGAGTVRLCRNTDPTPPVPDYDQQCGKRVQ